MGGETNKGRILIPYSLPLCCAGIRFAGHNESAIEPGLFFQKRKETGGIGLFLFPVSGIACRTAGTPAILQDTGDIAPAEIFGELEIIAADPIGRTNDNGRAGARLRETQKRLHQRPVSRGDKRFLNFSGKVHIRKLKSVLPERRESEVFP